MTDPIVLRNRFAMVKGAWDEQLRGVPFPSLGEGTAEQKIERLELALVDEMRRRMDDVFASSLPWLAAEMDGRVVGYAYATKWKARSAYRYSVETTVYLEDGLAKRGVGTELYAELFRLLKERGLHAVIGGIALPNDASVALHEKFGMRKVAHFEQVGFKFGQWVDVGYWQLTL